MLGIRVRQRCISLRSCNLIPYLHILERRISLIGSSPITISPNFSTNSFQRSNQEFWCSVVEILSSLKTCVLLTLYKWTQDALSHEIDVGGWLQEYDQHRRKSGFIEWSLFSCMIVFKCPDWKDETASQANQTGWSVHIRCASFTFYMFIESLCRARDGRAGPTVDKGNRPFWSHVRSKFWLHKGTMDAMMTAEGSIWVSNLACSQH